MQTAKFVSACPYEIGDKVEIKYHSRIGTITDIRTIHYLKSMKTEFEFEIDNGVDWTKEERIVRRVE